MIPDVQGNMLSIFSTIRAFDNSSKYRKINYLRSKSVGIVVSHSGDMVERIICSAFDVMFDDSINFFWSYKRIIGTYSDDNIGFIQLCSFKETI